MDRIDDWLAAARRIMGGENAPVTGDSPDGPQAMVIAPADMAIDPHTLCGAAPGTFYVLRLPGGLVPPSAGEAADRSVGAALEYAVGVAAVEHIILLTHPDCGMLRCLLDEEAPRAGLMLEGQFLPGWTRLIAPAVARAARADISLADRKRFCAQEMIRVSIENLMTWPFVLDGAYSGRLGIHGWYCDAAAGTLASFDPANDRFV